MPGSPRHQAMSFRVSSTLTFRDSSVLNPTPAPVDLEAAWVDHKALDAARLKEPRQLKRVMGIVTGALGLVGRDLRP